MFFNKNITKSQVMFFLFTSFNVIFIKWYIEIVDKAGGGGGIMVYGGVYEKKEKK